MSMFILYFCVLFTCVISVHCEYIFVTVPQGEIKGKTGLDIKNKTFYSFQGIPYAKPPVGELRFKAPQPLEKWDGVLDATKEGNRCYQFDILTRKLAGDENCLFLNIYTPTLPNDTSKELKAVMFWIHGGGFLFGSGNSILYGPHFLVAEDVVLVTMNYRLNLFGFLSFDDPSLSVPGNAGLKDQVMALKWIKENIIRFGGDPDRITIFGESAGGSSVHLLMLSPMAKGLFSTAISQSGTALNSWVFTPRRYKLLAKILNYNGTDNQKSILEFFNTLPSHTLLEAQSKLVPVEEKRIDQYTPIGVVIEPKTDEPAIITEDPEKIIRSGEFSQVPYITGYMADEGGLVLTTAKHDLNNLELFIPSDIKFEKQSEKSIELANKIKEFYYRNTTASVNTIRNNIDFFTDIVFTTKIHQATKLHSAISSAPTFHYQFSYITKLNILSEIYNFEIPIACHGDELGYLFTNIITPKHVKPGTPEFEGQYRIISLWTAFAKSGDPNRHENNDLLNIQWDPVTTKDFNYINIGPDFKADKNPIKERMKFWEEVYRIYQ